MTGLPEPEPYPRPEPRVSDRKTTGLVGRQNSDARAPISGKDAASENPVALAVTVPKNAAALDLSKYPSVFQEFILVFMAAGKVVNDRDNELAFRLWLNFDAQDHAVILAHLKRAVMDGTWSSERYTPMPASYLASKAWTRIGPGRVLPRPPRSESKAESAIRRAGERFRQGER